MSDYYLQFVEAIDESDHAVTDWEAEFIERLLAQRPTHLTEKQVNVIRRMASRYLGEVID